MKKQFLMLKKEFIRILKKCFESYIDRKKNKVLNKMTETCKIIDKNNNIIKRYETIEKNYQ